MENSKKDLAKEVKLKVLREALEKIIDDPLYNMCELIRMLTEKETGIKYDTLEIQVIYKLLQFKPKDDVRMGNWWPLNVTGQVTRQVCIESLIEDLEKE